MSSSLPLPHLLALDWGTSRLRAFLMCAGEVVAERESAHGIQHLPEPGPGGYATALAQLAGDWLEHQPELPLLACGMVGSAQGWREAPYVPCPADAAALAAQAVPVETAHGRPMWIVPGVSCDFAGAAPGRLPDVMRGEETQIAGYLASDPGFDGTLCLPGTHCKWVRIARGRVEAFQTYMTGEMFSLISRQSVLRLSLGGAVPDAGAAASGAADALADPHAAQRELFSLRAGALLHNLVPEQAAGRLSGLLIGAELGAARDFWHNRRTIIIGAPELAALYETPMRTAGADARRMDGAQLVLAGLTAAHLALQETS